MRLTHCFLGNLFKLPKFERCRLSGEHLRHSTRRSFMTNQLRAACRTPRYVHSRTTPKIAAPCAGRTVSAVIAIWTSLRCEDPECGQPCGHVCRRWTPAPSDCSEYCPA